MLKYILISILILCFSSVSPQEQNKSTEVFSCYGNGKIYVGSYIDFNCFHSLEKEVNENKILFIAGVEQCTYKNSKSIKKFYEIVVDGKFYYVSEEKIKIDTSYYRKISALDSISKKELKLRAIKAEEDYERAIVYKDSIIQANKLKSLKTSINQTTSKGLTLLSFQVFDESEHTQGTGVKFHVYNPTKKIIKYIWFNFIGYNPVGDPVSSLYKGNIITTRGVGPIHPEKNGLYEFNYVWHTDIVEKIKITSIKIQYMDNSIKIINNANSIQLSEENYETFKELE